MLDNAILDQLRSVFAAIEVPVALVLAPSSHDKQDELRTMLTQVASTSPQLSLREEGAAGVAPQFAIEASGAPTGIAFTGVPGGHEFTSLILAILYAAGLGKRPDEGLIARVQRLKGPVRLRTFVSLSCENCPDVVQALSLMASLHPDFEHEMVDGGMVPEEVEKLGIRGVPSVMHGETLVSSGKASLADLISRLEAEFGTTEGEAVELGHFDVVVVGGGPAGVSSAIYTARKGLSTVIISDRLGGQLQDTKGIENLISVPYTEGAELSAKLGEHLGSYDIKMLEHRRVSRVVPGSPVVLELESGETVTAGSLIVATGAKWRELGVPGEKEYLGRGVAFCPHCDGPLFKGKDIAVVGGGNSGVEAALDLAGIVKSVTVLEFMEEAKADAVLLDKLAKLPNATLVTNARTVSVDGNADGVTGLTYEDRATGETHQLTLDGVFVQIGLVPNSAFVKDVVKTNRYGEIEVDSKGRTDKPSIYAAGDVTTVPFKQIVIAMGEGAKAGLAAFEDRLNAA